MERAVPPLDDRDDPGAGLRALGLLGVGTHRLRSAAAPEPRDDVRPELLPHRTDMATTGAIEVAGRTVRFEGTGWFEDQRDNFRNTLPGMLRGRPPRPRPGATAA